MSGGRRVRGLHENCRSVQVGAPTSSRTKQQLGTESYDDQATRRSSSAHAPSCALTTSRSIASEALSSRRPDPGTGGRPLGMVVGPRCAQTDERGCRRLAPLARRSGNLFQDTKERLRRFPGDASVGKRERRARRRTSVAHPELPVDHIREDKDRNDPDRPRPPCSRCHSLGAEGHLSRRRLRVSPVLCRRRPSTGRLRPHHGRSHLAPRPTGAAARCSCTRPEEPGSDTESALGARTGSMAAMAR